MEQQLPYGRCIGCGFSVELLSDQEGEIYYDFHEFGLINRESHTPILEQTCTQDCPLCGMPIEIEHTGLNPVLLSCAS